MAVLVSGTISAKGVDHRALGRRAKIVLEALGLGASELSLSLVDDETIRRLNQRYRAKDRPTDVLSFSLLEGESAGVSRALGDVVISLDTARRQAEEQRRRRSGRNRSRWSRLTAAGHPTERGSRARDRSRWSRSAAAEHPTERALAEEVDRLLVHGILHLVGYDHELSAREERRMKRKEREMLRHIGEWYR